MNRRSISDRLVRRVLGRGPHFATPDVVIGRNVSFGENVIFNCRHVRIGDGVIFQDNIRIDSDVFTVGDYGTFYSYCFVPGPGELHIGHNFWIGTGSIVDSMGGTRIGNNVCVAAHSQLWTHMIYGDLMYGCRFHSKKSLEIGNDVWLGAHSLVSPVSIGDRSLVLFGSLVTKDVPPDRTYAGTPAEDVTAKFGPQFRVTSVEQRQEFLEAKLRMFDSQNPGDRIASKVVIVTDSNSLINGETDKIVFNVADRTYTKRGSKLENRLMRFLLPDAKFIPSFGSV